MSIISTLVQLGTNFFNSDLSGTRAKKEGRPLTELEVKLAQSVFNTAINYSDVRIANFKVVPWQASNVAVTPNGNIYFPGDTYREDFGSGHTYISDKAWFIHEMTHVWQYQTGVNVIAQGLLLQFIYYGSFKLIDVYGYKDLSKPFSDYNIEQQGDLVAQYYILSQNSGFSDSPNSVQDYKQSLPF